MASKDINIYNCKITEIKSITHDTNEYTMAIPRDINFNFYPGDHIKIYPDPADPVEFRPYTPTNTPDINDHFELIIKRYSMGYVSKHVHERKIGDDFAISGPHSGGHWQDGMARRVGMIAGGTGITPMISIIRSIIKRQLDVDISLAFANKSFDDIILRDEFDFMEKEYPNFRRFYVLENPPKDWDMGIGFVTEEIIKKEIFSPNAETTVFLCGPPMMQIELRKILLSLGFTKDKIILP